MKAFLFLCIGLTFCCYPVFSQLFYDDFEEEIDSDAIFQKWTTENLQGWHYWHIVDYGAQHMRFEKTGIPQDDWLISKAIDCSGFNSLEISFDLLYEGNGNQPDLLYTTNYAGNAALTNWTAIPYSICNTENEWCSIHGLTIDAPGSTVFFAFHYASTPESELYMLLDNFKVAIDNSPTPDEWVGTSEHFEFYTSFQDQSNYWNQMAAPLEAAYQKYVNNWDLPGKSKLFDAESKIKIYYTPKENLTGDGDILSIKSAYFDAAAFTIYLSPLDTPEKTAYYQNINKLALNTFAQYALHLNAKREFGTDLPEAFFYEGFGLYEQGYLPNRDSIISFVNANPGPHNHQQFSSFRDFQNTSVKDIITAYAQRSSLFHNGITLEDVFPETWNKFLLHFYLAEEKDRLKNYASSEYFNIYCTAYDTVYIDSMMVWMQRTRDFYNKTFEMDIQTTIGLYVMKDPQMGMDITGYGSFTGGSGGINLSPRDYTHPHTQDGIEGYPWLLAHEIGHVYNTFMSPQYMWYGFLHEGMANLSGYLQYGIDWRKESGQFDFILNYYEQTFGRPPTLTEFYTNPHQAQMGTYYGIHPYICGLEFFRMLYENYGGIKIKEFFQAGHDCTVFGKDSVAIHNEYISWLKHVRNLIPADTLITLPFEDKMESFDNGWSRPCINNNRDNWELDHEGVNNSKCLSFTTYNDKQEAIETWLVSPAMNGSDFDKISCSFDYSARGDQVALSVYYTNQYNGNEELSNWTLLFQDENFDGTWKSSEELTIHNSLDTIFIGFQLKSDGTQWNSIKIDNFSVREYLAPPEYTLLGKTRHFEFYAATSAGTQPWNEINSQVEDWYAELCSYWDRPGRDSIYEADVPVKLYLTTQQGINDAIGIDFPNWKYGGYKIPNELYLALPPENDPVYNGSFATVCKNVLSQLMLKKRLLVENNNYLPSYFSEAFGQYYCGYRPNKAAILQAINDYGGYPGLADIKSTDGFYSTYRKDLLVSYVEAQALSRVGIQRLACDGYETLWHRHFKYFYELDDDDCIRLRHQSEHFDLYFTEQDRPYLSQITSKLEEKYTHYTTVFDLDIKHRFSVIIYPSEEAGMHCLVYSDNYNGGSAWSGDLLDFLSPQAFSGGIDEALRSLIPHEFFHAFHFNFVTHLFDIAPFNSEGMAEIMAYEGQNAEYLSAKDWYFEQGFKRFEKENGREPRLADIMPDAGGYMSVYTYGQAFWYNMLQNYTDYKTIKAFFEKGEDWSVFNISYDEIDAAYIAYLKSFFEETATQPEVATLQASDIKEDGARLNGEVLADGGAIITQRGFYWSETNAAPNASDHIEIVSGTTGEFSFTLSGLSPESTIYFRAFASNSQGTAMAAVGELKTLAAKKTLIELPFFDDFSNEYENWSTVSLAGNEQWHISPDDGMDGSKCARSYRYDALNNEDDWLISKPFNTLNTDQVKVSFHFFYWGNFSSSFHYTSHFTGDIESTQWETIEELPGMNEWNWTKMEFILESPGEEFVFAIRYQINGGESNTVMLDNFSVEAYQTKNEHQLVGSSEHFNFYTNIPESLNYYLEIKDGLEAEFIKLNSNWNRPGQSKVFEDNAKIDVYYSTKENQAGLEEYVDSWRCGFYLADGSTLYLTPLLTSEQFSYYNNLEGEAVHTFSKMALRRRMARDAGQMTSLPAYFGEGFGLYEIGFRPRRDSIIAYLNQHPGELDHNSISDITDITSASKKDIVVSYVEGQILLPLGYRHCHHNYGSYPPIWNNYLHYFYTTNDVERIELNGQSKNFDIYCSSRDIEYVDSMLVWLERTRDFYVNNYEMEFNKRFHMCVLYDEKTGMDLTGYDDFNGGSGGLNISPHNFYDGIEGYPWLLSHEFGHVFNDYMYYDFPFGFYHEGMANFSGFRQYGVDWMESKWQIKAVFDYYQDQYGRYPKLEEFEADPDQKIDPYFFGLQFIRYLASFSSLPDIKAFFNAGLDFLVLGKTRSEMESGYINYLKGLNGTGNSWITSKPYVLSLVSNKLLIEASNRETLLSISLFDLRGRRIQYQALAGSEHNSIDLPLSEGVFVIQLVSDKAVYVEKIALHPTMSK